MANITYLVMDVDGTLTDGKIYMGEHGEIMKAFDIKDGYGIRNLLPPNNIIPVVITGRKSNIVLNRCNEPGIQYVFQGVEDKIAQLYKLIKQLWEIAYIGDDINDLFCMERVKEAGGLIGCPFDAVDSVRKISDYVAIRKGGNGAVRDFIEWLTP